MIASTSIHRTQPEVRLWIEFLLALHLDVTREGPKGPAFVEAKANLSELNTLAEGMLGLPSGTVPELLDSAVEEWERNRKRGRQHKRRVPRGKVERVVAVDHVDRDVYDNGLGELAHGGAGLGSIEGRQGKWQQ